MGYLIYNDATQYAFDDRTLAHLKVAIAAKLRLQESFLLSWTVPPEHGSGRVSIWISPAIPLQFVYHESRAPELNRKWLEALARYSHGVRGMIVMTEQEAEAITSDDPMDARVLSGGAEGVRRSEFASPQRPRLSIRTWTGLPGGLPLPPVV